MIQPSLSQDNPSDLEVERERGRTQVGQDGSQNENDTSETNAASGSTEKPTR